MLENESADTEKRLLEAAGEVFAEYGYRAATVRQICEKAGANIAAVNYHFGDKEGLYIAVLRLAPKPFSVKPCPSDLGAEATAEEKLRAYVGSLLHRVFDKGRPGWHTKLLAREMMEPTRALDMLVEEGGRPMHRELASIIRELLGSGASDKAVRLCSMSVMSQCVYYHLARPVITRLYPEQRYGSKEIEEIAEHISQFSLLAIKGLARRTEKDSNRRR